MSQATTRGKFALSPEVLARAQAIVDDDGHTEHLMEELGLDRHIAKGVYRHCLKHKPRYSPVRLVEPEAPPQGVVHEELSDSRGSYLEEGYQQQGTTVVEHVDEPIKTPLGIKIVLIVGVILSAYFVGVLILS